MAIGSSLKTSGHDIDLGLVEASALLHDISKMECIGNGRDHAAMGRELLSRHGYPLVADVVGQHGSVVVDAQRPERRLSLGLDQGEAESGVMVLH